MKSRLLSRRCLYFLLISPLLSSLLPVAKGQGKQGTVPVTLKGQNKTLREALKQLFEQTKVRYKLDKKAEALVDTLVVSYNLEKIPLENALFVLLLTQGKNEILAHKIEKGVFLFYTIPRLKHTNAAPAKVVPAPLNRVSTLHLENLPLKEALELVLSSRGIGMRFAPEIFLEVNKATVSADISQTERNLEQNVELLLKAAHLKIPLIFSYQDGIYVFAPDKVELIKRKAYTLDLTEEALDATLIRLLTETQMSYGFVLPANPQKVTLALQNCPFEEAITKITEAANISPSYQLDFENDLFFLSPIAPDYVHMDLKALSRMRVTLNLKETPLRSALKALLQPVGVNYAISAELCYRPITVTLTDAPFITALEAILKGTPGEPPCKYRIENGVCMIDP